MIDYISNTYSNIQEWQSDLVQSEPWRYYVQERAVIKGLPIAVISTIAASYLFNCAKVSTGAIFGAVNYITLTSLLEIIRAHHEIDRTKAMVILGISSAISLAFIQTICKTAMSYQTAIILSVAAFAGQLSREFLVTDPFDFE